MKLRPRTLSQIRTADPPVWVVQSLFVEHSFNVLWGPEGSKKSFLAFDLAFSLARGESWLGHAVHEKHRVLYVLSEGQYVARNRLDAWERVYGTVPDNHCEFLLRPINLMDENYFNAVDNILLDHQSTFVIFDTLAACTGGMVENASEGMGKAVLQFLQLRRRATVLIIHHATKPTKDHQQRARGHSSLDGAADSMLEVLSLDGVPGEAVRVVNHKNRAGKRLDDTRVTFREVKLDRDRTSLVIKSPSRA